jgi:hypothetical protein
MLRLAYREQWNTMDLQTPAKPGFSKIKPLLYSFQPHVFTAGLLNRTLRENFSHIRFSRKYIEIGEVV